MARKKGGVVGPSEPIKGPPPRKLRHTDTNGPDPCDVGRAYTSDIIGRMDMTEEHLSSDELEAIKDRAIDGGVSYAQAKTDLQAVVKALIVHRSDPKLPYVGFSQDTVDDFQKQIKAAEQTRTDYLKVLDEVTEDRNRLKDLVAQEKARGGDHLRVVNELVADLASMTESRDWYKNRNAELHDDIDRLKAELTDQGKSLANVRADLARAKKSEHRVGAIIDAFGDRPAPDALQMIGDLAVELSDLKEKVNAKYWDGIKDDNHDLKKARDKAVLQANQRGKVVKEYQEKLRRANDAIRRMDTMIDQFWATQKTKNEALQFQEKSIFDLQSELARLKGPTPIQAQMIKDRDIRIIGLRKDVRTLQERVDDRQKDVESRQGTIEGLRESLDRARAERDEEMNILTEACTCHQASESKRPQDDDTGKFIRSIVGPMFGHLPREGSVSFDFETGPDFTKATNVRVEDKDERRYRPTTKDMTKEDWLGLLKWLETYDNKIEIKLTNNLVGTSAEKYPPFLSLSDDEQADAIETTRRTMNQLIDEAIRDGR